MGGLLAATTPELQQLRGRKRALKKPLSRQERLLRRQKREEKEAARKQYSFMERIKIRRMKALLSPSQQGPGRYDAEAEAELPEAPACNVYFGSQIVPVPHAFKHNEKRTILAFAADKETQDVAVEAGAELALGGDMIKKIVKGLFRVDDYDFCVAHSNMHGIIAPLRGILRSRFPTKQNGAMGDDLPELIERFRNGVKVSIKGDPVYPIWGLCEPVVGKLGMPDEQLEENIRDGHRSHLPSSQPRPRPIRKLAPEFYDHLTIHTSWFAVFYDFIFDPEMSLRSRIKRKMAPPSEFHFYGVGVYATSYVYRMAQTLGHHLFGFSKPPKEHAH
ncbi:hypothetical protein M3Y99_01834200 [Aphelenchoides fujianensis]|nr:hypothetical protein M3Y99_01834200 [Aphelenchoides fujianensis]